MTCTLMYVHLAGMRIWCRACHTAALCATAPFGASCAVSALLRNRILCWRLRMLQRHCRLLARLHLSRSRYILLVHDVHPHVRTRGWHAHLLLCISHGCTLRAVLVSSCIRLLLLRTAHLPRGLLVDGSNCSTLIVVHLTRLHCVCAARV